MLLARTVLVIAERFAPRLGAAPTAAAIARGIGAAAPAYEIAPVALEGDSDPQLRAYLDPQFLRAARAVVLASGELLGDAPPSGPTFELATTARQTGVPSYAVTGVSAPDLFSARLLDIQVALCARGERALVRAGEELGGAI